MKNRRLNLTIILTLYVLLIMTVAMVVTMVAVRLLMVVGIFDLLDFSDFHSLYEMHGAEALDAMQGDIGIIWTFVVLLSSTVLGFGFAILFNRKALKPIRRLIAAINEVGAGNFDVSLKFRGISELEELSQSFTKMTAELSSIEVLRRDFINNFSHEFKTPIVSIRGFAKLLKDGDLSEEERREYLEIIIAETERLANLATNVLNLSKYESTQILVDRKPFDLAEQIRRAGLLLEPKWSAKGLTVNLELEPLIFNGDENLTQQIWLNLLDNAIKFSREGGAIDIGLAERGGEVIFTIQDTGIGMSEETARRVFDKFYQGEKSHANVGNGLGLSLVRSIVELCGGSVRVESEVGVGSLFEVRMWAD
ncbi:MAG: HAMP domain-containing histidine kinase [Turicibacter sp.]|nr:HAMP domain-containing histidine kinase [Turicibacter sp.]